MNIAEILLLKFPNSNFRRDIIIQDDGHGPYIKEWNLPDPKPTQANLDQWAIDLDLPYRQQQAVMQRIYPSIADQLDMLYHDQQNKTTVWFDTITAIKAAHPKPVA